MDKLPTLDEWHSKELLKRFNGISWNESIKELHEPQSQGNYKDNFYQSLMKE